jgi:hypothetical protein
MAVGIQFRVEATLLTPYEAVAEVIGFLVKVYVSTRQ